jgi:glutamate---cysteine ligase / carboxylate-amine ligase
MARPPLTLGIEEEYMIIDPQTRELSSSVHEVLESGRDVLGDQLKAEFMQSQVEIGTHVCRDIHEARADLLRLRRTVSEIAQANGRRIAAAATHPFSRWDAQNITQGERYDELRTHMQDVARRLLIFGMHIHLGFGTDDSARALTIDTMNQIRYFLPHILALSTSSPFWHGRNTGLKSYRCVVFENLPRTGIPPLFNSYEEYDSYLNLLTKVGALGAKDATKIWWDARPNVRIGTLEIRVPDVCTTVDEAVCIAAVIQALVAKMLKLRAQNQTWRLYRTEFIRENKWRASRFGIDGELIDFGAEQAKSVSQLWSEILDFVDDVLDEYGLRKDVEYVQTIIAKGTSADRQIAAYNAAISDGCTNKEALIRVVDHLVAETYKGE